MYWQVDNGAWNVMPSNYIDYPHKETMVDVSRWNWKGVGPYKLTFIATDLQGKKVAQASDTIYNYTNSALLTSDTTGSNESSGGRMATDDSVTTQNDQSVTANPSVTIVSPAPNTVNPLLKRSLYVETNSAAAHQGNLWRDSRPGDAAVMDRIAAQSQAKWFGGWNTNIENDVRSYVQTANKNGKLPVIVAYNIPQRDCGSYSAGGSSSAEAYLEWIHGLNRGIGNAPTLVILEPDALGGMDCLSNTDRSLRQNLLSNAVAALSQSSSTYVYLDAGNPRWHDSDIMAQRLKAANIAKASGFSLNVSNFITSEENIQYGTLLSQKINNARFVIDTSRNGVGPTADSQWCNPAGRALGKTPTTITSHPLVDAFLWIKTPGESDGSCDGAPSAGTWWPEYALGLARTAGW